MCPAIVADVFRYVLHAIRLSALRTTDDPLTPRIVTLDPTFGGNPYVQAMGLSDIDKWPEIKRALDSPEPEQEPGAPARRRGGAYSPGEASTPSDVAGAEPPRPGGANLRYTQTIMPGNRTGGLGMRVTGRRDDGRRRRRDPDSRPRADSEPEPKPPSLPLSPELRSELTSSSSVGGAAPSLMGTLYSGGAVPVEDLGDDLEVDVDEGSDVDDDEVDEELVPAPKRPTHMRQVSNFMKPAPPRRVSTIHEDDRRSSTEDEPALQFGRQPLHAPRKSALTALLNAHVPHLVSTGDGQAPASTPTQVNPFNSLYASVAAPPTLPSLSLELFYPHSDEPSEPVIVQVRKDATVEEVTGYALWKYWEEGLQPPIAEEDCTTINWGLRIVEDDGEVDEDFPALDRESKISKFSYGQFGIVKASESQRKQNEAMMPLIQRRPSRIIAEPTRPPVRQNSQPAGAAGPVPPLPVMPPVPVPAAPMPALARSPEDMMDVTEQLSSSRSRPTLLRVRVEATPSVAFTTTLSVPSDMYIADLTEVLVQRKSLQGPSSEWVLCLGNKSLALPLDRTVASLGSNTELALVTRRWALENGLGTGDRRGGDPNANIFKRTSEHMPPDLTAFTKYTVLRKTGIGKHERVLAIDGDYIHVSWRSLSKLTFQIMPSENRGFFDTMKTTSFHVTLVANVKLSGRAGGFKLYVWRDGGRKRYEFEAENGRIAAEIVDNIKEL